jgi:Ketopantoate reductase
MRNPFKNWRAALESEQALSITAYTLGVLWGLSIIIFPSRVLSESLLIPYGFAYLWASAAIIGGITATWGSVRNDNLLVELLGLQILLVGPAVYGASTTVLTIIQLFNDQQVTAFSVSLLSWMCFVLLRKRAVRLRKSVYEVKLGGGDDLD